ncbi:hypothetical protein K4K60_007796 [Colletotrichum sp. SAR11_57]|nr:hypothetical protein CFRS1_v000998 [Colletotrichum fructicola]KAF5491349.1 hypothetical protein CGCF413_v011364 [Colletotrichum fructicola]KAI8276347.1 hypothetical protein K4K60_007796 [Colletotrichum sp. SAR11_57]
MDRSAFGNEQLYHPILSSEKQWRLVELAPGVYKPTMGNQETSKSLAAASSRNSQRSLTFFIERINLSSTLKQDLGNIDPIKYRRLVQGSSAASAWGLNGGAPKEKFSRSR